MFLSDIRPTLQFIYFYSIYWITRTYQRYRKPKGQSGMNNPEKMTTQDTGRRQTKHKNTTQKSNRDPIKTEG